MHNCKDNMNPNCAACFARLEEKIDNLTKINVDVNKANEKREDRITSLEHYKIATGVALILSGVPWFSKVISFL